MPEKQGTPTNEHSDAYKQEWVRLNMPHANAEIRAELNQMGKTDEEVEDRAIEKAIDEIGKEVEKKKALEMRRGVEALQLSNAASLIEEYIQNGFIENSSLPTSELPGLLRELSNKLRQAKTEKEE